MIRTIRLKDLIKYLVGLVTVILIAVYSTRFFSGTNKNNSFSIFNIDYENIIKTNISIASYKREKEVAQIKAQYTSRSGITRILDIELPNIEELDEQKEVVKQDEEVKEEAEEIEERKTTDIKDTYTNKYKSVTVKNLTDIKLTEAILKPDYNVKNKKMKDTFVLK